MFIKETKKIKKRNVGNKGQGLVEYLIIVALIAVAGITVMKLLGQNIRAQYANIADSIQGKNTKKKEMDEVRDTHFKSRDMSDFFRGSTVRSEDSE